MASMKVFEIYNNGPMERFESLSLVDDVDLAKAKAETIAKTQENGRDLSWVRNYDDRWTLVFRNIDDQRKEFVIRERTVEQKVS